LVEFVLLTAVPIERDAVLARMQPLDGQAAVLRVPLEESTYYLGYYGRYVSALVMGEAGDYGRAGSGQITAAAVTHWNPRAVIMVGIAFGLRKKEQVLGDVLVSTQVIPYVHEKITPTGGEDRGPRPESSLLLLNRLRNSTWTWTPEMGPARPPKFGPLLSGPKLVNDRSFTKELATRYPTAIGGEMEGAGLYGGADRARTAWVIIKAVCDWGFSKGKAHQSLAAANACALVADLLAEPGLDDQAFRRRIVLAAPPEFDALLVAQRAHQFETVRIKIRGAHDEERRSADALHAFVNQNMKPEQDGTVSFPASLSGNLNALKAANQSRIEATLNAYEDGAHLVQSGGVEREPFVSMFGVEVRQLFELEGPHASMLQVQEPDPYPHLRRLYKELAALRTEEHLSEDDLFITPIQPIHSREYKAVVVPVDFVNRSDRPNSISRVVLLIGDASFEPTAPPPSLQADGRGWLDPVGVRFDSWQSLRGAWYFGPGVSGGSAIELEERTQAILHVTPARGNAVQVNVEVGPLSEIRDASQ
jgi:nucleoside phosphorylase